MMRLSYLPLLMLFYIVPSACQGQPAEKIAALIKQGNAHEIAVYFAENVDIAIAENSDSYAKVQAELILDKFFKENKPKTVRVLHKINSNAKYNFEVLILATEKGLYRVSYTMCDLNGTLVVIELRIESEKT